MSVSIGMRTLSVLVLVSCTCNLLTAQMKTGEQMKDYAAVFPLNNSQTNFKAILINSNAPGCIFAPDEQPQLVFQVQNLTDQPIKTHAQFQLIAYGTRGIPGDIWQPEVYKISDIATYPVAIDIQPNGWQNIDVAMQLPPRHGGYAAILDMGSMGKQLAAKMTRAFEHEIQHIQYPKQSLETLDPSILARMGIQAIRYGVAYHNSDHPNYAKQLEKMDSEFARMKEFGVTATVEIGAGSTRFPLGRTRPHLDAQGNMQPGKQDYVWLPQDDDDYQQFCKLIAEKYGWPKGPVIGMMLWNEPWEGRSISGWQADMIRYRELYKRMGIAIHQARAEAGVDVLVGGCDSSSNTWDKLFPDGTDEFLPYLDFCSIHYQGISSPALYRKWVNRKGGNGRVLIWDTESWVANTDDRFAGVVATNRAAGYDRSMGVFGGNVATWDHHRGQPQDMVFDENGKRTRQPVPVQTWPLAASVSAVQHFLGQRDFNRILIQKGLPWIYVFDGMNNNPDDGTIVVLGDIGALFGRDLLLYRTVTSIDEARAQASGQKADDKPMPLTHASLSMPADSDFGLYDYYGNPVTPTDSRIIVPLDDRGFFLRADPARKGSFAKLTHALEKAYISGLEPLEIIPLDILGPIGSSTNLNVLVSNILNRSITGKLTITLVDTVIHEGNLTLAPYQKQTLNLNMAAIKANTENTYAFKAIFEAGDDGFAFHQENLHVNRISHRTITIDGKLDDWTGSLPQTVTATGTQTRTLTEAAWLPFEKFDPGQSGGLATAYLAYDKDNFYFAVKVADDSNDPGMLRFETRDQNADFYPDTCFDTNKKTGKTTEFKWPEGVRHFSYRRSPELPSGNAPNHDNVLIAFNAIPFEHEPDWITHLPGRMPLFTSYKCSDYEYALNSVSQAFGGGYEVWRLQYPGLSPKHFYPRQPKHPLEGPVKQARMITVHQDNTRITELAMPWTELPHVKALLDAGKPVKFSCKINNNTGGPDLELAMNRGISRQNNASFHTDWKRSWANEVQFVFEHDASQTLLTRP